MKHFLFICLLVVTLLYAPSMKADECSPDDAMMVLKTDLAVQNGLDSKRWQASPSLAVQIPEPVLQQLFARLKSHVDEVELQKLSHDANSQKIQLVVRQLFVWDTLQLQVDFPAENRIRVRVLDNWIPSDMILSKLESSLRRVADKIPLRIEKRDSELELALMAGEVSVNGLRLTLANPLMGGVVMPDGGLGLKLESDKPDIAVNADMGKTIYWVFGNGLGLSVDLCGQPDTGFMGGVNATVHLDLTHKDLLPISVGSEKLAERLQAAKGEVVLEGLTKLSLEPFTLQASGDLDFKLDSLEIEQQTYQKVSSVPFKWRYGYPYDFEIYPELPALPPSTPRLSNNQLTLFTDGPAYFSEIKTQIAAASESVAQEVFSFHRGEATHALARLLTLKALGLKDNDNDIVADPMTPDGIRVYLLHNHHLTIKGTREVQDYFTQVSDEIFTELAAKGQDSEPLRDRLRQNLRITPLNHGVAWADHRKLLIIDGRMAYVGGRNLGDSYLLADSFHDQMIRVEGPAVADLRAAYATNWDRLNPGQPSVLWSKAPLSDTPPALSELPHLSQTAVLTTSHRGWEIASALVQSINEAKSVIRIEHAYLYHEPIEAALRAAKARGVEIRLLFSERSDESVFERLNPGNALKLMNAPGPGKVRCWLWQGPGGKDDYMVHTKFLSVDGKIAIAGSANLIPRSLQSPFTADGQPLLFNEELVLYIADPHFVATLDEQLFETDVRRSREAGPADLQALIEARGGALDQLIERLKGLMS